MHAMEELKGIQVVYLRPDDKVLVNFDTDIHDIEGACEIYKQIREFFPERPVLGVFGTEILIIKEEEDNEDNIQKYFTTL